MSMKMHVIDTWWPKLTEFIISIVWWNNQQTKKWINKLLVSLPANLQVGIVLKNFLIKFISNQRRNHKTIFNSLCKFNFTL